MIPDCDRRSDGRSDGRTDGQTESIMAKTALCIASYADALSKTLKSLSTLSQKSATVAEFGDCRRIRRLSPLSRRFLRQSHFSATVWTGLNINFFSRKTRLTGLFFLKVLFVEKR